MFRLWLLGVLISAALPAFAADLTVGTWNIHKGKKWERITEEFRTPPLSKTHILALQEVLTRKDKRQAQRLAQIMRATAAYAGRDVILSRFPIQTSGSLIVNPDTGRQGAWADIFIENGALLRFYSLHLSYKIERSPFIPEIREREMLQVLKHAEAFRGPVIIAGDFNTVGWLICCHQDAPLLRRLREAGYEEASHVAAGRTQLWVGRVDYIFSKGLKTQTAKLGRYAGSDHRWIRATLSIP